MLLFSDGRAVQIVVGHFASASKVGRFMSAVSHFLRMTNNPAGLREFEGVKTGKIRLCRATQKERLRNRERVPLMLVLDRITLDSRLCFIKTQLRQTSRGLTIMRQTSTIRKTTI
jgi:hypothetical protein